jgi:flagellar basal body-associated protein FliL
MNKNRKISIIIILSCVVIYTISSIVTYHIFTVNDDKNLENEYELKKEKSSAFEIKSA